MLIFDDRRGQKVIYVFYDITGDDCGFESHCEIPRGNKTRQSTALNSVLKQTHAQKII